MSGNDTSPPHFFIAGLKAEALLSISAALPDPDADAVFCADEPPKACANPFIASVVPRCCRKLRRCTVGAEGPLLELPLTEAEPEAPAAVKLPEPPEPLVRPDEAEEDPPELAPPAVYPPLDPALPLHPCVPPKLLVAGAVLPEPDLERFLRAEASSAAALVLESV
jgi:hypothetical protein